MAGSTFTGSVDNGMYQLQIRWSSYKPDNCENSSIVHVEVHFCTTQYGSIYSNGTHYGTVHVNGTAYTMSCGDIATDGGADILLIALDQSVAHNSSGNASIGIYADWNPDATLSGTYYSNIHAEGVATMDNIPHGTPGVADWGPNCSPSPALGGAKLDVVWGGPRGGAGKNCSFSYSELQWNFNDTAWGAVENPAGYESKPTMPNIPGGHIQFRVRLVNNFGLASDWVYSSYIQCLGASTLNSVTGFNADDPTVKIPFSMNVYVASYTHSFYLYDKDTGSVITDGTTPLQWAGKTYSAGNPQSLSLTLSDAQRTSLQTYMKSRTSVTVYLAVDTYNGSSQTGSRSTSGTACAVINSSVSSPTCSAFTFRDSNTKTVAVTGNNQWLVQNLSTLQVTIPIATPMNGAAISSYIITGASISVSKSVPGTYELGIVTQSDDTKALSFTLKVVDTRGFSNIYTTSINVASYFGPTISTSNSSCLRNGYVTATTLAINGTLSTLSINKANKNVFSTLSYRYLPSASLTPTVTTMASGSTTLGISSTVGMSANESISGTGIPSGTYIASIPNTTTLVLTKATTASATSGTVTVGGDYSNWIAETPTSKSDTSFSLLDTALDGDLETNGFTSGNSFTIQAKVTDTMQDSLGSNYTATFTLPKAIPVMTFQNAKVGINNPNPLVALDIIGSINVSGTMNPSAMARAQFKRSSRDFTSGTLIKTSLDYTQSSGAAFLLEIKGNSYGTNSGIPRFVMVQGYMWNNTIINYGGISSFQAFNIQAFNYGGNLCFWFPRTGYWEGFDVWVSNVTGTYAPENLVASITDEVKPSNITKEVTIVLNAIPLVSYDSNGYPQLIDQNGVGGWERTKSSGLIPSVPGGSGSLGTTGWPFNESHVNAMYGKALALSGGGQGEVLSVKDGGDLLLYNGTNSTFCRVFSDASNTLFVGESISWGGGIAGASGTIQCARIQLSSNGSWDNIKPGDDCWLGDCNCANTLGICGSSNVAVGLIKLGQGGPTFGNTGDGYLHFNSNYIITASNIYGISDCSGSYMEVATSSHGAFGVNWWASDSRLKKNIVDSGVDALSKINTLKHRAFDWIDPNRDSLKIGYIAQELQKVIPETVYEVKQPDDYEVNGEHMETMFQIDQTRLIPYLTKAIQQLSDKINELEAKISVQ